jgi:hypothetical protein
MKIERDKQNLLVNIGTTVATSTEFSIEGFAGGSFQLPSTSGTTAITIYARLGTLAPGAVGEEEGTALSAITVTAGRPTPLPSIVYNFPFITMVASAGTATDNVPVFIKG